MQTHDIPRTLAENELAPTYPDPILVEYTDLVGLGQYMLWRNTLRSLGFCVDDMFVGPWISGKG